MLSEILEYGLKLNFLVKSLDCLKLSNLLGETCPMVIFFEDLGPFFQIGTWVHFFSEGFPNGIKQVYQWPAPLSLVDTLLKSEEEG